MTSTLIMALTYNSDMKPTYRTSSPRSLIVTMSSALMVVFLTGLTQAQSPSDGDPNTLIAARKTFATADADMDGLLSKKETEVAGVPAREFVARDKDKSGSWSGEEFLLYYYGLLNNSGKKPDEAFEKEVARIEAARKAQKEEELRRTQERLRKMKAKEKADAASENATGGVAGETESIEQKLKRAQEALKDRSKRADADRDAFDRTAGELAERARGAAGGSTDQDAASSEEEWAVKLRRARAALERRAKDGRWSREQLEAADRRLIERARAAEQGVDLTQLPAPVRSKYERALVALTDRAQEGSWTREKYEAELADLLARAKEEMSDGGGASNDGGEPGGEVTQARRTYERALAALDERAKAGDWTRERYEAERAELAQRLQIRDANDGDESPNSGGEQGPKLRSKVDRAQEKLDDRARRAEMDRAQHARISEELFERARQALQSATNGADADVRSKYERALALLIKRAQEAEMTRGAFENERDDLIQRARLEAGAVMASQVDYDQAGAALIETLKSADAGTRTKYGRAMVALISRAQKAGMTRAAFEHERDGLISRAREEARAGGANQKDFDAAQEAMTDVVNGSDSDIRTKHQRAMNALISRAQKAGMTRTAFELQRDELLNRARREAGAGGGL